VKTLLSGENTMKAGNWQNRVVGMTMAAWFAPGLAAAAPFPDSPIRIVLGIPVGASPDIVARALAAEMPATLGQAVIVENRPGAGGTLATTMVAAAPPDGYTLNASGCSADAIVYGFVMNGRTPLDPFKDFTPVGQLMRDHWVVLVSPERGIDNLRQLATMTRDAAQPLSFPSQGEGSSPHLQAERLARKLGFKALHVPYKDSPLSDLAAGRLDFAVQPSAASQALVKAGKLKALAVLSMERLASLPDVPTAAEAGLPAFTYNGGICLWAPGGTPRDVVARLNDALNRAAKSPAVAARFEALGVDPTLLSPEATARSVAGLMADADELRAAVFGKSR
jgi:tripartite-type tricarboxylate transporter receptor subunit TctC